MVPFRLTSNEEPELKVTLPVLRTPVPVDPYDCPGEIVPVTLIDPAAVPLVVVVPPPSVAPLLTETGAAGGQRAVDQQSAAGDGGGAGIGVGCG